MYESMHSFHTILKSPEHKRLFAISDKYIIYVFQDYRAFNATDRF